MMRFLTISSLAVWLSTVCLGQSVHDSSTVILRFAGDLLLAGHYEEAAGDTPGIAFENFNLFRTDDVSVVNHECPITDRGTKTPKPYNFRMRPTYTKALTDAGIELVNLANNHIFDYGEEGLFDTISYLDSAGVFHVGAGRTSAEARKPNLMKIKGRRIGFLGYYGGGEAPAAGRSTPGVAPRNLGVIRQDLKALRQVDSVDFVVVLLHWGTEKATMPDSGQQEFAHSVIDAGADAVVGHHAHVLQGIERYRNGVIAYSLGNFVFGGNSRDTYDTALLEIRLTSEGTEYDLIPVGLRNWRLRVLEGAERDGVIMNVSDLSKDFPGSIFLNQKENP